MNHPEPRGNSDESLCRTAVPALRALGCVMVIRACQSPMRTVSQWYIPNREQRTMIVTGSAAGAAKRPVCKGSCGPHDRSTTEAMNNLRMHIHQESSSEHRLQMSHSKEPCTDQSSSMKSFRRMKECKSIEGLNSPRMQIRQKSQF
jgi:hypothetical protein